MTEPHDTVFDQRLRALHHQALQATPAALRARLKPAATQRSPAWPGLAIAGVAALFCVGVFTRLPAGGGHPAPQQAAAAVPGVAPATVPAVPTAQAVAEMPSYDNDPEFYAWLASAPQLASADTAHR